MAHKITPAKPDKPDEWWYKVYAAVVVTTIVVIAGLGMFSAYYSN